MNPFLPLAQHRTENRSVQVLSYQSLLATAAHDGSIIMHDANSLQPYLSLKADFDEPIITNLKFESEHTIWTSYKQGEVLLWDLRSRSTAHVFSMRAPVTCFDTNSEQNLLAIGTDMIGEDSVYIFEIVY
jgi:WD40 repeat protein